jgi:thiamine-monophosphate kinase
MPRRLRDLGEHGWIGRLLPRLSAGGRVLVGPGDDAAVLRPGRRPLLVTVDALAEGTHFRLGWETPAALGRRAFRVNASDVAAMGGVPVAALVAIEAPPSLPAAVLDGIMRGLTADARRAGAAVVGGNLTAGRRLVVTVTLLGEAPGRVVTRAGAKAGDLLVVTGTLGGAGLAVCALQKGRRARRPAVPSRLAAGRALARFAHAMIDVSDGVLQDAGHVARASGVALELSAPRLPVAAACRAALGDAASTFAATAGEDYELLAAVPPRRLAALRGLGCALTVVGRVRAGRPVATLLDAAGRPVRLPRGGFDHFG